METKNSKRRPKLMAVNKKAVANIGMDTVRNFSRYNRITKDAIGKRIIEMAGKERRQDDRENRNHCRQAQGWRYSSAIG